MASAVVLFITSSSKVSSPCSLMSLSVLISKFVVDMYSTST
nr:MAG TPA: hypothetical protein [Caudoviricetes sp.]